MFAYINRIKQYYGETVEEVKRCTWPTRQELAESTMIVVVTLLMLTVFVWVTDQVLQWLVRSLVRASSGM